MSNSWTVIFPLGPETAASYLQKIQVDKHRNIDILAHTPLDIQSPDSQGLLEELSRESDWADQLSGDFF